MVDLTLQPVRMHIEDGGTLVFADGVLVAVLVALGAAHDERAGWWFLETGYGPLDGPTHPCWPTLDEAKAWIAERLTEDLASERPAGASAWRDSNRTN